MSFMTTGDSTVTIHMVSSLDGFIAKKNGDISWFETTDHYERGATEESSEAFNKTVDCYVMGARTYEHALELSRTYGWIYGDVPTVVLSHRNLPVERKNVTLYTGDLQGLVRDRLTPKYRNIWLVGGAMLAAEFIRSGLADDIRLSILPIILGDGVRFLDHVGQEQALHLKDVTTYKSGMVELWYELSPPLMRHRML